MLVDVELDEKSQVDYQRADGSAEVVLGDGKLKKAWNQCQRCLLRGESVEDTPRTEAIVST